MKKIVAIASVALLAIACQQPKAEKTAYVDTSKIFNEYTKVKDAEAEILAKSEKAGKTLDSLAAIFQKDVQYFQENARTKGQKWAEAQQQELMQRDNQLKQIQQSLGQGFQKERAEVLDSIFGDIKVFIGEYAKKNDYSFVLGTGEVPVIMYGKEEADITSDIIEALNAEAGTPATTEVTPAEVKEEEAPVVEEKTVEAVK